MSYSDLFWFMRSYFAAARSVLLCRGNLAELKEGFNCQGSSEVNSFSGFYWKLINSLERRDRRILAFAPHLSSTQERKEAEEV